MRHGLGLLLRVVGVALAAIGLITAVQMAGNAPWWQIVVFAVLVVAVGGGVFLAGGRVAGRP